MKRGKSSKTDAIRTREAIEATVQRIDRNPFFIRTERDVLPMLYCELLRHYPKLYQTAILINHKKQKTTRVHREYYYGTPSRKRVDLVVFDEKDVENINVYSLRVVNGRSDERVRLSDAIEVKAELGGSGSKRKELAMADIERLKGLMKDNGCKRAHFVYILRWPTKNRRSQRDVERLVRYLKNQCKKSGIHFYLNRYKEIFQEC